MRERLTEEELIVGYFRG